MAPASSHSGKNVYADIDTTGGDNSIARRLKKAAVKIHSNASAISNARPTVWAGSERVLTSYSEWGEPLSLTARGNIKKWLSQPRTNDITEDDKNLLLDPVQEYSLDSKHAYLILEASYVLGQIFVLEGDFENAEIHSKRTIVGRRRLLSKDSKDTYEAIQLLVVVYSSEFAPKEVKYETEVWRDMLPPEARKKDETSERPPNAHNKNHTSSNGTRNTTLDVKTPIRSNITAGGYPSGSRISTVVGKHISAFSGLLDARLLGAMIHHGKKFSANTKIKQTWLVWNPGPSVWPVGCYVHCTRGDTIFESGNEHGKLLDHTVGIG